MTLQYDDTLSHPDSCPNLWRTVLLTAIEDALHGPPALGGIRRNMHEILEARAYLTVPNDDFDTVCFRAGLDPIAVRERLALIIDSAPPPEAVLRMKRVTGTKRLPPHVGPGVARDFPPLEETGAWSFLQETPNLTFSDKAETA